MSASRTASKLSRRQLVALLAAAPALAAPSSVTTLAPSAENDPAVALCQHWLALEREQDRLLRRWGRVESWLADKHDWFKLSKAEQLILPEARRLYEVDKALEELGKEASRGLRRIERVSATSLDGAMLKLGVVATVIEPCDYPGAHRVLTATIMDLRTLPAAQSA